MLPLRARSLRAISARRLTQLRGLLLVVVARSAVVEGELRADVERAERILRAHELSCKLGGRRKGQRAAPRDQAELLAPRDQAELLAGAGSESEPEPGPGPGAALKPGGGGTDTA